MTSQTKPRVTSLAPQFLVDDLERSIAYYQRLGFRFGELWGGFYAIGCLDGLELHLKEAPKNPAERQHRRENGHLDASAGVEGIEAFYEQCVANGAKILKPLAVTPWGTKDFDIAVRVFHIEILRAPMRHRKRLEDLRAVGDTLFVECLDSL